MRARAAFTFAALGVTFGALVLSPLVMYMAHFVHGGKPQVNAGIRAVYGEQFFFWTVCCEGKADVETAAVGFNRWVGESLAL